MIITKKDLEDSRKKALELHRSENGDSKCDIRVCGFDNFRNVMTETKCCECTTRVYLDPKIPLNIFSDRSKNICPICVLKNHKGELTALQIEILEKIY